MSPLGFTLHTFTSLSFGNHACICLCFLSSSTGFHDFTHPCMTGRCLINVTCIELDFVLMPCGTVLMPLWEVGWTVGWPAWEGSMQLPMRHQVNAKVIWHASHSSIPSPYLPCSICDVLQPLTLRTMIADFPTYVRETNLGKGVALAGLLLLGSTFYIAFQRYWAAYTSPAATRSRQVSRCALS